MCKGMVNRLAITKMVLVLMMSVLCPTFSFSKESPQSLLESLPATIKTFKAKSLNVYEDQKLGASLSYSDLTTGTSLDLYLYDMGEATIPDGIASAFIRTAKEGQLPRSKMQKSPGYTIISRLPLTRK